jgi:hypothetical protein
MDTSFTATRVRCATYQHGSGWRSGGSGAVRAVDVSSIHVLFFAPASAGGVLIGGYLGRSMT